MMLDADWVYREFLRRGYRQDYAADFLDAAWNNSGLSAERLRTEPDHEPLTAPPEARDRKDAERYRWMRDNADSDDVIMEVFFELPSAGWDDAIDAAMQKPQPLTAAGEARKGGLSGANQQNAANGSEGQK